MAFNGSGTFSRLYSWAVDAAGGVKIRADRMDSEMNGFATGLSTCITKDGQTTITANLPMSTYKHTNVGSASSRTDYARFDQLQDGKTNWVDSGGTADSLTATYSPAITTLVDGQLCYVRAGAANATTTPTFSPNGLTARVIVKNGGAALAAGDIAGDGHELILRYDLTNTRWELLNSQQNTPDGSITFPKLDTDIIASATDTVITASDIILFGDASDSNITKRDTVQGILDLVGTGALVYLGSATASASATLDFTSLLNASLYSSYVFEFNDIVPASSGAGLLFRTSSNNGSSWDSSAGNYSYTAANLASTYSGTGNNSDTNGYITSLVGIDTAVSNNSVNGKSFLYVGSSKYTYMESFVNYLSGSNTVRPIHVTSCRLSTTAVNAVRFLMDSGNITSGTIRLYGVKKS